MEYNEINDNIISKDLKGSLTQRIKKIKSHYIDIHDNTYNYIISHCFDGIDPREVYKTIPILNEYCKLVINKLHEIDSAGTGVFMDYLMRRLFQEIRQEPFIDNRAERYIIPDNSDCNTRYKIEQTTWIGEANDQRVCKLPYCQLKCYEEVKDTINYKTEDILKKLYIVSCSHFEDFDGPTGTNIPYQCDFEKIIDTLDKIDTSDFITPLNSLCKALLTNIEDILLNPIVGYDDIPADADAVIDNTLIDFKCTISNNEKTDILQLLGYTSLLNHKLNKRMNYICIINLLCGECKIYNIQNILDNNLSEYYCLLKNEYYNKKITIRKNDKNKNIKYPLFVNSLQTNYSDSKISNIDVSENKNKMRQFVYDTDEFNPKNPNNCWRD